MPNYIPEHIKKRLDGLGAQAFYCPFCKRLSISPKNLKIKTALCAICTSMERHRVLNFIYDQYIISLPGRRKILHIAPEKSLYDKLSSINNLEYLAADLEPKNFPFIHPNNIVQENGMHMSFEDKTFDFIIHNHVLEHVPDDKVFIAECLRVLKDDGKCIVSFPYDPNKASIFDVSIIKPEERKTVFGWYDHVRLYGYDFLEHFNKHSYTMHVVFKSNMESDLFSDDERIYMKLDAENPADVIAVIKKNINIK